ncbi:YceI family protein [Acetobacteraceae bacterium KSS8]|uniref:YceI family protein n=1 Tax=Endosaccharibacter trunci TaxID=2812733 RepID=A0ABT1W5W3_9PROT|nr:YceI family protein [Acetobacteraceae bacterium KSS8]
MKSLAAAGLAACTLLAPGIGLRAASAQDATHVAAQVKDGTYQVEPGHTQVGFTLLHLGFSYYSGVFSGVTGTLVLDKADPSQDKLDVTIPVDSVLTTSTKLDGELKGAEWFDTARFPTAHFVSTKVTRTGKDTATVAGTLTLHGVSHPETLSVRFVGAGINPLDKKYTVGFAAAGEISRSAFGVKTYVPLVGDDVKLNIAGAFERQD